MDTKREIQLTVILLQLEEIENDTSEAADALRTDLIKQKERLMNSV